MELEKVALAPVHQAVPVAAVGAGQALADPMRPVEVVEAQPEGGQAGLGQLLVVDRRGCEQDGQIEARQPALRGRIGAALVQRHGPDAGEHLVDLWCVGHGENLRE